MEKEDLFTHSPVRYFDKATSAGLKDGQLGLITSKKGLGKTSILVQFGLDSLLNDKALVHVSFDQKSSNVISWYSSILSEIAKKKNIKVEDVADEIMKNRTILNFNQETFTLPKVVNTIKALKEGGITVHSIVVDGLDLAAIAKEDLNCFKAFVEAEKLVAWFSYTNESGLLSETLAADKLEAFTTVGHIFPNGGNLYLGILKNGDGKVYLDAKTLLMTNK